MERFYVLDPHDRIADCGGGWDRFALENGGGGAVASRALGRTLWEFVAGQDTREYLNGLFHACRRGRRADALYRCDGPCERRLFRMSISPRGEALVVRHVLIRSEAVRLPSAQPRLQEPAAGPRCSLCGRVSGVAGWDDAQEKRFPAGPAVARYVLCPDCRIGSPAVLDWPPAAPRPGA